MAKHLIALLLILPLTGCIEINPLSPELQNEINNQNGKIEDIKNNQNGIMLDLMKIRNEQTVNARDIESIQQGIFNKSNNNDGIQILQGDGALVLVFAVIAIAMILIYHYRLQAGKATESAKILAQQIALYDDIELDNAVFMSAMHTEVEEDVYQLMVDSQASAGR